MDHRVPHPELYRVPWTTDEFSGMPYRLLGRSGLRVSSVGLGTWKFGYPETGDGSRTNEKTSLQILDRAIELGVTFWDTANRYNDASGNSERIIGTWLDSNPDQRRNVVLATKVFGGMDGRTPNHSRLSRGSILDSVYACLERLLVDYIDVLYFHGFDGTTPVEESLTAVEDLVEADLVRHLAVSNYTADQLAICQAAAPSASIRCRVLAVQNEFNIVRGEDPAKPGVLAHAARTGVSFVAWSPLGRGLLTERYLDMTKVGAGDRLYDEGTLQRDAPEAAQKKLQALATLASEWGLQLNQLALAYMLTLPGMGPVIPSATSVQHLESNAAAGKVALSDEQKMHVKGVLTTAW